MMLHEPRMHVLLSPLPAVANYGINRKMGIWEARNVLEYFRISCYHKSMSMWPCVNGVGNISMRNRDTWVGRARPRDHKPEAEGMTCATERSEAANEELLLFFFQVDLTIRLQRAMNQNQYEVAQELRERIAEVDKEILKQKELKTGSVSAKEEVQDVEITLLRLRSELNKAVETEDYAGAAHLRDKISRLEANALAASAKALASQHVKYVFRLGQKIRHKVFGYRGVICGMDLACCAYEKWIEDARIDRLSRGRNQPFYQVLVDVNEEPTVSVAYVAEENLVAPEEPDLERIEHPYIYFLFYGMDSAGDFIPIKQLREKYNAERHEVPSDDRSPDEPS